MSNMIVSLWQSAHGRKQLNPDRRSGVFCDAEAESPGSGCQAHQHPFLPGETQGSVPHHIGAGTKT